MPLPHETLIEFWSRALTCEIGLAIKTNARRKLLNELYTARKEAGQAEFSKISLHLPADETEVWLVRKDAEDGDTSGQAIVEDNFESL